MTVLTIHEVAAQLGMSERWLRDWLGANPMDADGRLFYTPIGRRRDFDPDAADRIRNRLREIEQCRLSSTGGPVVKSGITGERLVSLVKENVFGARLSPKTKSTRRVQLPKSNGNTGTVIKLAQDHS